MSDSSSALVLFSGGQDSATCLAWALDKFSIVETIGFDYGQRHRVELDCRQIVLAQLREGFPQWRPRLREDHILDAHILAEISNTALTSEAAIGIDEDGLPNTFVPGRNLLFLTLAGAIAYRRNLKVLVAGMCETDFSGYPDCRDNAIKAMQLALAIGMDRPLRIETPLMWIDKSNTWNLAQTLGGDTLVSLIIESTHTCYVGDRSVRHAWGYGCGHCPACKLREEGFRRWRNGP